MAITARLFVTSLTHSGSKENRSGTVVMGAAYAGGRNQEWASSTPTANLTMTLNAQALALFEEIQDAGMDVAVTFEGIPRD